MPWRETWGQCLAQGYLACRPEQSGIEPPTYRVADDLLHLLNYSHTLIFKHDVKAEAPETADG